MRIDNRCPEQMRPVTMEMGFQKNAGGSCLISVGNTRVLCAASVSMSVPPFLTNTGKGWLTAEYGMLPGSTGTRKRRPGASNDGRSVEIQRLIGRSLRAIVDLKKLDGLTIQIDCDVLDADGGTRTASITGAWCALKMLVKGLEQKKIVTPGAITGQIAAVSCGIVDDVPVVDLCYQEDSRAQVDMNIVMTDVPELVEVQGTGEGRGFTRQEMNKLLDLSENAIQELFRLQRVAVGEEI